MEELTPETYAWFPLEKQVSLVSVLNVIDKMDEAQLRTHAKMLAYYSVAAGLHAKEACKITFEMGKGTAFLEMERKKAMEDKEQQ